MNTPKSIVIIVCAAIVLVAAGCASTYNPPRTQKQVWDETVDAPSDRIYKTVLFVLRRSGYRMAFADQYEGRISTRPRTMPLTDKDCDCGGARGIAFSAAQGTNTDVSYIVIVRDGGFSLRTLIQGQYVASDTSMVKRFECVSRGGLEKDMVEKIKDGIAESALTPAVEQQ
jgi:hypothetical protein